MRIDIAPEADPNAPKSVDIRHHRSQISEPRPILGKKKVSPPPPDSLGGSEFRELFQSVYDAALITTVDGAILSANERAVQHFGSPLEELTQLTIRNLVSGMSETMLQTICDTLENDRFVLIQAFCSRSDGSLFPAEVSVNRLNLANRGYLSFFVRDVTVRKESEDKLRTGHTAIQNSGNGIAVANLDCDLTYCNEAMVRLLHADKMESLLGQNFGIFLIDQRKRNSILEAVQKGHAWSDELEMRSIDDQRFFAQASVAPNVDSDNELMGMVVSLSDISDQKRIQRELQEHNMQMEEDLKLAREFQRAFICRECPVFPEGTAREDSALASGYAYIPSGAVGGDFFDIFAVSEHEAGVFISDVMGHGIRSALVVATLRGLVEELASLTHDPGAFLTQINRDLAQIMKHSGQLTFVTALYAVIDLRTGEMRYASAGHPSPYRVDASTGRASVIPLDKSTRGPALALFGDASYSSEHCDLGDGDALVFYTDGVCEAENADGEEYAQNQMLATIEKGGALSPIDLVQNLVDDLEAFCEGDEFDDDLCILAVTLQKRLATPPKA